MCTCAEVCRLCRHGAVSLPSILLLSFHTAFTPSLVHTTLEEGSASFLSVHGFAVLPDGTMLVADKLDYKVKRVSARGKTLSEIGQRGSRPGEFLGPGPIDVHANVVAVADFASARVQILTRQLSHLFTFRAPGPVFDLHFDHNGNLWLGTYTGERDRGLVKCSVDGTIQCWAGIRNCTGDMFADVFTFDITRSGKVVVCYLVQNRVEVLDTLGRFLREFSIPGLPPSSNLVELQGSPLAEVVRIPEENVFVRVTVDRKERMLVLAGGYSPEPHRRVYMMSLLGRYLGCFVLPSRSQDIVAAPNGHLFSLEERRTVISEYKIGGP